MKTTTVINIQILIQAQSNKLVNRSKLINYINEYNIDADKWYYQLLTLHSFQVATELKMLKHQDIWE